MEVLSAPDHAKLDNPDSEVDGKMRYTSILVSISAGIVELDRVNLHMLSLILASSDKAYRHSKWITMHWYPLIVFAKFLFIAYGTLCVNMSFTASLE